MTELPKFCKNFNDMFNHFDTIPERDRYTYIRTDYTRTDGIFCAGAVHGINNSSQ